MLTKMMTDFRTSMTNVSAFQDGLMNHSKVAPTEMMMDSQTLSMRSQMMIMNILTPMVMESEMVQIIAL